MNTSSQEVIGALMQTLMNQVGERLENDPDAQWVSDVQWATVNLLIHEHGHSFVKNNMPKQYAFWAINRDYMKTLFQTLQHIWIQYENNNAMAKCNKLLLEETDTLAMLSQYKCTYGIQCHMRFKKAFDKRQNQLLKQVSALKTDYNIIQKRKNYNMYNDDAKTLERLLITYQRMGQELVPVDMTDP